MDNVLIAEDDPKPRDTFSEEQRYIGRGWRIDWENQTAMKLHSARRYKYTPRPEQCPIPMSWLTGKRIAVARFQDRKDKRWYYVDNFLDSDEPHKRLRDDWTGYTVFQFSPTLCMKGEEADETIVNEVNLVSALQCNEVEQGKTAELEKLLKYEVEIIAPEQAAEIRNDKTLKRRILPSRFVITKKPDEKTGQVKTKCRWCIRGYLDPDLT